MKIQFYSDDSFSSENNISIYKLSDKLSKEAYYVEGAFRIIHDDTIYESGDILLLPHFYEMLNACIVLKQNQAASFSLDNPSTRFVHLNCGSHYTLYMIDHFTSTVKEFSVHKTEYETQLVETINRMINVFLSSGFKNDGENILSEIIRILPELEHCNINNKEP